MMKIELQQHEVFASVLRVMMAETKRIKRDAKLGRLVNTPLSEEANETLELVLLLTAAAALALDEAVPGEVLSAEMVGIATALALKTAKSGH